MTSLRSSRRPLLLSVLFAAGVLSLTACGGEIAPTSAGSNEPAPAAPAPGPAGPGAPPGPAQPSSPPASPSPARQGSALVGDFGHQGQGPGPSSYDGATIHATSTGAALDFQCMHSDASALIVDASGAFEGHGTLTTTGGVFASYPDATFTGTVSGDTVTFTATWPSTIITSTGSMPYTETYGPETFTKGVVPTRRQGCI